MNLFAITNLNNYMKTQNMKRFVELKKQNPGLDAKLTPGGLFTPKSDKNISGLDQQDNRLTDITYKMNSGKDLSVDDMEYLRQRYPEVYEKALKQKKEKQEYEKELRNCETKEDVRNLHMQKTASALSRAKEAISNGDVATCMEINAKMNTFASVLADFVITREYNELADSRIELEEMKEAIRDDDSIEIADAVESNSEEHGEAEVLEAESAEKEIEGDGFPSIKKHGDVKGNNQLEPDVILKSKSSAKDIPDTKPGRSGSPSLKFSKSLYYQPDAHEGLRVSKRV